jgi:glutathione synthase/RimK-type ligase-like ATP-grasp enzyme
MEIKKQKNKWIKYSFMNQSKYLSAHLPETKILTRDTLKSFIEKYGTVIVKPVGSRGGFGVILISSIGNEDYKIHIEKTKETIQGNDKIYEYLENIIKNRDYIVQRWIPLAKVKTRPFDMRIIVQRRSNSDLWRVTGTAAKVAGKGYFVTNNTRSNGTMLPVNVAIQRSTLKDLSSKTLIHKINRIALLSAKRLRRLFPRHRIYGLDIGLDEKGHIWIIEANLYPAMSHFKKLGDRRIYRRIMDYKRG